MENPLMRLTSPGLSPEQLCQRLQTDGSAEMRNRRALTLAALAGIASMAVVTLKQMGIIGHLPDPPVNVPHFHSDKVNSTDEAYGWGMPDGPLTLAAHGITLALAAAGPPERARRRPWLPLLAAAMALPQAAIAAKYLFHRMPKVDKAWCPYCVADALVHFATLGLTVPEAATALRSLRGRRWRAARR